MTKQYLLLKKLHIEKANGLQDESLIGVPSVMQFHGFVDALNIYLNKFFKIKFKKFAVSYHNHHFVGAKQRKGKYELTSFIPSRVKTEYNIDSKIIKNGLAKAASLSEDWKVNMCISLIIEVEQVYASIDKITECISDALEVLRVCGGKFAYTTAYNPIELIENTDNNNDKIIKNKLMPGQVTKLRNDLISEGTETPLENMLECIIINPKQKRKGWFVPMVVGYKELGICDETVTSKDPEKKHYFVETIKTICEMKIPTKFNTIDDFMLQYEYKDGKYIVKN